MSDKIKTAEGYLKDNILTNTLIDTLVIGGKRIRVSDAMEAYAQSRLEQVIPKVLEMAADEARMTYHDGHTKIDKPLTYFQFGADNLKIDKQSILSLDWKSLIENS